MIPLLCTVRGCALPLDPNEGTLRCLNGHAFDLAGAGYANLLQPQDRRSSRPGDRKEAVRARRRLFEKGYAAPLFERLLACARGLGSKPLVLDAGCGEGTHLGRLGERLGLDGSGIDISSDAVAMAAKRYPRMTWVVGNADRWLPYPDRSFDLVVSITARRNPSEFARVLREGGAVFIAVPAADDLGELREAVQGESAERSRVEAVARELEGHFAMESSEVVRERRALERDDLVDLLQATYRGLRHSERQRVEWLERMDVTFAWDVMVFRGR